MGIDLSGFPPHNKLTEIVRCDGYLGGRQGCLLRMSAKLFALRENF